MDKPFKYLVPALVVFVVCFLMSAFFNRYASDDFEFLYQFRELGFTGSVKYFYHHWNTRWLAIGWMNVVFIITGKTGNLIFYHLFSFALLWISFYLLLKNFLPSNGSMGWITSGYMSLAFFYSCFSIEDVFFWVNTSTMYLYGTIAFIYMIGEVIDRRNHVIGWIILVVSSFYLGGAYEPLVFTSMLSAVIYLIYMFGRYGFKITFRTRVLKVIICLSVLMIAFAISYAGEGHTIRATFLPQTSVVFKLGVLAKAYVKMIFIFIPSKILATLLFAFPFMLYGVKQTQMSLSEKTIKRITIAFLLLALISLVPVSFIMSEMGPERAWTQVSLYLLIYASIMAFYAGTVLRSKYNFNAVSKMYGLIGVLYVIATSVPEVVQARNYSKAYDARMWYLKNRKSEIKEGTLAELPPLPEQGWLHSAEITTDATHFTNQHLKKYLELKFDIVKEEGNPKK